MPEVELPNPKELEEMKEKGFPKRVALITAIFAVILALSSPGGEQGHERDALDPTTGLQPMVVLPGQSHP